MARQLKVPCVEHWRDGELIDRYWIKQANFKWEDGVFTLLIDGGGVTLANEDEIRFNTECIDVN